MRVNCTNGDKTSNLYVHRNIPLRRSLSVIKLSDEGEEQAEEKQKPTPGAVMKHWNCDDTRIFFEDTIYFSGTAQEDVGNINLIEEYIVSMATTVDSNRWFRRSASSVGSTQ
ncbi:uncharacterized protein [Aegilops tauschii subsp. strangulata]|uniref:uncharacterized protein n=1 Tax=Aegilops tauschii subsp. strangulata TaxID=200361 RepID=UPI003CC89B06